MTEPDWKAELLEDRITPLAPGGSPAWPTPGWRAAGIATTATLAVALILLYAPGAAFHPAAPANATPSAFAALPTSLPTATTGPTPTSDGGPCVTAPLQVTPPADTAVPAWYRVLQVPETGLAAFTVDETNDRGTIVVAGAGADGTASSRVVATYGSPGAVDGYEVVPLGWSASGDTLLVVGYQYGRSSGEDGCSNLFLVNADGSGVTTLTDNGPGEFVFESALAPATGQVAYGADDGLQLIDPLTGDTNIAACLGGAWTLRWSPDERSLLAFCGDRRLMIVDVVGKTWIDYQPPSGLTLTAATWAGDGSSITVVANESGSTEGVSGPLAILDFSPETGAFERRALPTPLAASLQFASISPDGRWIVLQVWSDVIEEVAVLSLETGATTTLPIPPAQDFGGPTPFAWYPDGDTALFGLSGVLYTINVATTELVEVGLLPTSQFAWHNLQP